MKIHRLSLLVFAIAFSFFAFGNAHLPITDPVESNYALTAKEMVVSGNWLSPQIYHQFWFDKPIMIYWLIALSYKVFGFFDFAARFPSTLFGALSVAMLYQQVRVIAGRRLIALWSALILGTSLEFWIISHGIITDMVLMFATIGTMSYAYRGLQEKKPYLVSVAYAFAGLAVLTKGPVGIVLPGVLLLAYALCMRSWDIFKRLFPWHGIVAFFVVAAPWYFFMYQAHGQAFLDGFLGLHNVTRATVSEHPEDNVWWYYLALTPLALLPWTGPVIYEMVTDWSRKPFYMYLMVWCWGTVLFYSLMATKYPTYTFISLIAFSVLGSIGIVRLLHPADGRNRLWILTVPAVFLWLLYAVASFYIEWGFWYLLYVFAGLGTIVVIVLQLQGKKYILPFAIALVTMLVTTVVIHEGITPLVKQRSALRTSYDVKNYYGPIYYYGGYDASLVYYTDHTIKMIVQDGKSMRAKGDPWQGKYTMPKIEMSDVVNEKKNGKRFMIIVPLSLVESFETTEVSKGLKIKESRGNGNKQKVRLYVAE